MKREISSTTFYKRHDASYFCSAVIDNGHVLSLYSEYGREGGEIWSPKNNANGNMQHCLTRLCRDFGPKFYEAVYKAAYNSNLLPTSTVESKIKQKEIKLAKEKVIELHKEYTNAVHKLEKLLGN